MNAQELIAKHEKCIKILELIQSANRMKKLYNENILQYGYQFPELKNRYEERVIILHKVTIRLINYYENQSK